jgi:hypothetical protein
VTQTGRNPSPPSDAALAGRLRFDSEQETDPPHDISCWLGKKLQYRVTRRQESDSAEVNASTFFAGKTGTIHKSSLLRRDGAAGALC